MALSDKSRVTAGLLQLFLGGFGVGRFYTGHIGMAIGQIAAGWGVFFLMICLGFLLVVPWLICWVGFIWPMVDGIILLTKGGTDAEGRMLRG
ncbi:MAG: TM2 domain-containing protein [Micromonosporaceae bacterium]|nr:TM2 domain-containing protein [Micromonosporaceae bacterium]